MPKLKNGESVMPADNPERLIDFERIEFSGILASLSKTSLEVLSRNFLGDESSRFLERFDVVVKDEGQIGNVIPVVSVDFPEEKLKLIVESDTIADFVYEITEDLEEEGVFPGDITKLLVGAGAGNAVLAWKTLNHGDMDKKAQIRYRDMICDKRYLWMAADRYDDLNDTNLRLAVEQLTDDQVPAINALRFSVGLSIHYLSDATDLPNRMTDVFRTILVQQEQSRALDLKVLMSMNFFTAESAFDIYSKSAPQLMYALSFPMEPDEEISSIFAQ